MTRRLVFSLILAAALATAGPWPFGKKNKGASGETAAAPAQGFESQYTSGTVAAIPLHTNGKLDLTDRTELRFHYGKPSWTLNYDQIARIEVSDKQPNEMFYVPGLMKKKRTFTIQFLGKKNLLHSVRFETNIDTSLELLPLLEERSGKQVAVAGAQDPEGWWGNRYWRTARNSDVWEENGTQQKKTTVAQTQEE